MQNYRNAFNDKTFKNAQLDTLITIIKMSDNKSKIDVKQRENLELLLTTTFFKYTEKAFSGINRTPRQLDWFIPRKKINPVELLDEKALYLLR